MLINEKTIKKILDKKTNNIVLMLSDQKSISWKYLGNFIVQYVICDTGKTKLQKNKVKQKNDAKKDALPFRLILGIALLPFEFWWYFAPFLDKFSIINKSKIKSNKTNESWFAVARSSNDIQAL